MFLSINSISWWSKNLDSFGLIGFIILFLKSILTSHKNSSLTGVRGYSLDFRAILI